MKQHYKERIHDGIGYSKNGEEAWFRGERPRSAPDFSGTIETVKHHIEVPDKKMASGYRRVFAMFYKHAAKADLKTRPKVAYAVVSKNGIIIRVVDTMEQAKAAGAKMISAGAGYILQCKVIPDGEMVEIDLYRDKFVNNKDNNENSTSIRA